MRDEPGAGRRSGSWRRSLGRWLVGGAGLGVVGILGWTALQPSDPASPFDGYLLRVGFLCGALGLGGCVLLHKIRGWPLTVPRVLGTAAIATAIIGPTGALIFGFRGPPTDVFEWLHFGLFSALGFAMLLYGWRGPLPPRDPSTNLAE